MLAAAAGAFQRGGVTVVEPRVAAHDELARVHDPSYIDAVAATAGNTAMLDADTFTSPGSYDVALLAAGAAILAVEHALATREPAFALVRPPGHHAERDRAMGFCLFNNAAVAAAAARAAGCKRVAIVDIDVHHGNGTQWIFYDDPTVLYVSSHQYPFYPGTGAANETGSGAGVGFTVNLPLAAGATDQDVEDAYGTIGLPALQRFAPDLTIISAGYDGHEADPLAQWRMTAPGYARLIGRIRDVAHRTGPLALVTEGGYDLGALRECLDATIRQLLPPSFPPDK